MEEGYVRKEERPREKDERRDKDEGPWRKDM